MKNNINKKIGATLLAAAIMAGTAVIPMSNAAVEEAVKEAEAKKPSVKYEAHVQDYGWRSAVKDGETAGTTGESRRLEAVKISLENCEGATLNFDAHIQNIGWRNGITQEELVGTEGQSLRLEAIVIRSTGLKQKGYKLQYRVHVQYMGWMDWTEEGYAAGTEGMSLRIEAIEVRVVEDLKGIKDNAIATLESYDATLDERLNKPVAEGGTEANIKAYEELAKKIEDAKKQIKDAKTEEEVKKAYDSMVAIIKRKDPAIEENTKKVMADKAESSEKGLAKIAEYTKTVPNVEKLTPYDRNNIQTKTEEAINTINNAKTPREVKKAISEMDSLMNNYGVVLKLAQTKACEELDAYLPNASTGVKKVVADSKTAIKSLTKAATAVATTSSVESANLGYKTALNNLITEQQKANQVLDVYEDTIDTFVFTNATEKSIIEAEIDSYRAKIDKATTASDVGKLIDTFKNKMNTQHDEVAEAAADELENVRKENEVAELKNSSINALNSFANSKEDKEEKELATEFIKEYVEKINNATTTKQINDIMNGKVENDTEIPGAIDAVNGKIRSIKAYESEYEIAMRTLGQYSSVLPDIKDEAIVSDVTTYIENTISNIIEAKDATAVNTALNNFLEIMSGAKYAKVEEAVRTFGLGQIVEDAKAVLNTYKNSSVKEIKDAATRAITAIDSAIRNIDEESTADEIDEAKRAVAEAYDGAMDTINASRLNSAYSKAYDKLGKYAEYTAGSTEINNAVQAAAKEALNKIVAITVDEEHNIEDALMEIDNEIQNGLDKISEHISVSNKQKEEEFEAERTATLAELKVYEDMAKLIEDDDILATVAQYKNIIGTEMTVENSEIGDFDTTFARFVGLVNDNQRLTLKVDAINTLNGYVEALKDTIYLKEKEDMEKVVTKAIREVKAAKDTDEAGEFDRTAVGDILENVAEYVGAYEGLDEVRDAKIDELEAMLSGNSTYTVNDLKIKSVIDEIKDIILISTKVGENETDKYAQKEKTTLVTTKMTNLTSSIKFVVTFDVNGGKETIAPVEVSKGGKVSTLPTNPTKDSTNTKTYTFNKWVMADGTTEFTTDTEVTKDMNVKAVWTEATRKYTVTFDVNGGSESITPAEVEYQGKVTLPANPTKDSTNTKIYTFAGWYTKNTEAEQTDANKFTADTEVTEDITVYAKWTEE